MSAAAINRIIEMLLQQLNNRSENIIAEKFQEVVQVSKKHFKSTILVISLNYNCCLLRESLF